MRGGRRKVRVAVDAVVHDQVARQHLAIDTLATAACAGNRFRCFDAGDVHDVDRHPQHVGNGDRAVDGFALDDRWA